jgi:hypothetical protein
VLVDTGGTGKTTLAVEVVRDRRIQCRYRDGVAWLDVGQHPEPDCAGSTVRQSLIRRA